MTIQPTPLITTALLLLAFLAMMVGQSRGVEEWRSGGLFLMLLVLISSFLSESFACSECSAGFCLAAGWWVWRRRHPAWALASLLIGLLVGTTLGLSDMMAARHASSVTVWAAVLTLGLAHGLYLYVQALRRLLDFRLLLLLVAISAATQGPTDATSTRHARFALTNLSTMSANFAPMR